MTIIVHHYSSSWKTGWGGSFSLLFFLRLRPFPRRSWDKPRTLFGFIWEIFSWLAACIEVARGSNDWIVAVPLVSLIWGWMHGGGCTRRRWYGATPQYMSRQRQPYWGYLTICHLYGWHLFKSHSYFGSYIFTTSIHVELTIFHFRWCGTPNHHASMDRACKKTKMPLL